VRDLRPLLGAAAGGAAALLALLWLGAWALVGSEYDAATARLAGSVMAEAASDSDQMELDLAQLDHVLSLIERRWERNPADLDVDSLPGRITLADGAAADLFITNSVGHVVFTSDIDLTDDDIKGSHSFLEHAIAEHDTCQPIVGRIRTGRRAGRWRLGMARRLDGAAGQFGGVVGLTFGEGFVTRLFRRDKLAASNGFLGLTDGDGGMLLLTEPRRPDLANATDEAGAQPIVETRRAQELLSRLKVETGGYYTGRMAPDERVQLLAASPIDGTDLSMIVGTDADNIGGQMRFGATGIFGAAVAASAVVILLAIALVDAALGIRRTARELERKSEAETMYAVALVEAKAEAERQAAAVLATIAACPCGILQLDGGLRVVSANALFAQYVGIDVGTIVAGAHIEAIAATVSETGGRPHDEGMSSLLALLTGTADGIFEWRRRDGGCIELRRSILPSGGSITVCDDISSRKRAQAQWRGAQIDADVAVQERTRFVATISHELRNALDVLLGSLDLLATAPAGSERRRRLEAARGAGRAILRLLDDSLKMSRLAVRQLELRAANFDLRPLLLSLADMYHLRALRRGLVISVEISPDVSDQCIADPGRLHQILINLLSNAVKYSGPGRVTLRAAIVGQSEARIMRLSVCDAGPPIPEGRRIELFQPFSRLVVPEDDDLPGTGIGLSICLSLAEGMGGAMGHRATCAGGNEFWLTLPCRPVSAEAPAITPVRDPCHVDGMPLGADQPVVSPEAGGLRVLLVEDLDANRDVTATLLRRRGFQVEATAGAADALHILSERDFDVVLTDLSMPGLGGVELARAIHLGASRAMPRKIIGLSALVTDDDRLRAAAAGMAAVLQKPLHSAELDTALDREPATNERGIAGGVVRPTLSADRIEQLRTFLAPEALRRMIGDCLAELVVRMTALRAAADLADMKGIEQAAHAMAGLAGNSGLAAIEERLRDLIAMARAGVGDATHISEAVANVEHELTRASAAITSLLPALD